MAKIWQAIQGLWSKFRSNPIESAFARFLTAIEGLESTLRFVALMVVAVLLFLGLLDYFHRLTLTPSELAGGGVFILLCIVVALVAHGHGDPAKKPVVSTGAGQGSDTSLETQRIEVLRYIAGNDTATPEGIADALDLPQNQVNESFKALCDADLVRIAPGHVAVTTAGRAFLEQHVVQG